MSYGYHWSTWDQQGNTQPPLLHIMCYSAWVIQATSKDFTKKQVSRLYNLTIAFTIQFNLSTYTPKNFAIHYSLVVVTSCSPLAPTFQEEWICVDIDDETSRPHPLCSMCLINFQEALDKGHPFHENGYQSSHLNRVNPSLSSNCNSLTSWSSTEENHLG